MTTAPTAAMVLAAGLGTRMRAGIDDPPKPLVTVAGETLLGRMMDRLVANGVQRIVVNVHHRPEMVEAFLYDWQKTHPAISILISDERSERLETGGGVKKALPLINADAFYICNADILWHEQDQNLARVAHLFDATRMDACLLVTHRAKAMGYDGHGDFNIDSDALLTRGQDGAAMSFAGVQIATAKAVAALPNGPISLNVMFDKAIATQRLYGYELEGQWMHVGTPEGRAAAEAYLQSTLFKPR
jgi:MurNAc alpha-1-phosphate uridylyltransferase